MYLILLQKICKYKADLSITYKIFIYESKIIRQITHMLNIIHTQYI